MIALSEAGRYFPIYDLFPYSKMIPLVLGIAAFLGALGILVWVNRDRSAKAKSEEKPVSKKREDRDYHHPKKEKMGFGEFFWKLVIAGVITLIVCTFISGLKMSQDIQTGAMLRASEEKVKLLNPENWWWELAATNRAGQEYAHAWKIACVWNSEEIRFYQTRDGDHGTFLKKAGEKYGDVIIPGKPLQKFCFSDNLSKAGPITGYLWYEGHNPENTPYDDVFVLKMMEPR